jgi:hypothetical protein
MAMLPSSCSSHVATFYYRLSLLDLVAKAEALQQEHPAWPAVALLQRFSCPLQRYTKHLLSKKWFSRFFILKGGRVYYSDGKNRHPDTREGTAAFVRSNPAPDGRYCVEVRGSSACANDAMTACWN